MTDIATRERLERIETAVVRSLDLLESGCIAEARDELVRAIANAPAEPMDGPLSEQELERAFDAAEPEVDQMIDADRVAQVALRQAGADELHVEGEAEGLPEALPSQFDELPAEVDELAAEVDELPAEVDELPEGFATATMADLLERQGDSDGASKIRASLASEAIEPVPEAVVDAPAPEADVDALAAEGESATDAAGRPSRRAVMRTLERWLDNVREARA
ncbi:MAG: hypothetical protein QNK04_34655 [Myxococcota bacterium]|nr:hypothetical protein [Myxococcota bacterium]